ncbi:unnamed protein product [Durusdinium trenchii]|uniref:Amidase domain-containing protein n=2 Tax=Durusdinium trenchii TaxID=1381693 RepID=A0ABP0IGC0_9DINO
MKSLAKLFGRFRMNRELHLLEAHEIVALLKAGSVSPLELIDVVEERIKATDDLVHDTHAVEGVRFTEGSLLYAERIAETNASVVSQLEANGAIIVGKTNVPEFCAGSQSFNSLFPTTVSPWDTRTTAGGSSGGSAAALASYQCWLATGTDLGGSLRMPAAFCGCVGFRVSPGRTPTAVGGPMLGLHSITGPMGRSVRDVGLFLDAMASRDGWDVDLPSEAFEEAAVSGQEQGLKALGLKVGFSTLGYKYAPEVESLCRSAAHLLNNESEVQEVGEDKLDSPMAERIFHALRAEQFAETFGEKLENPDQAALLKPEIRWNIQQGQGLECRQADEAREDLKLLHGQLQEMFQSIDVLCVPATLDAAIDATVRYPTKQLGQCFTNYLGWMMPTAIVSVFSCPAIVLPCGFLEDGRPVGLQLLAPFGADAAVLRAAAALEARLALPKGTTPRPGTGKLNTEGPRTSEEAAQHHGLGQ